MKVTDGGSGSGGGPGEGLTQGQMVGWPVSQLALTRGQ